MRINQSKKIAGSSGDRDRSGTPCAYSMQSVRCSMCILHAISPVYSGLFRLRVRMVLSVRIAWEASGAEIIAKN